MLNPPKTLVLGFILLAFSPSLSAQGSIWVSTGDSSYDFLGMSADQLGDVNGDGIPDILAGAHGDDPNGQESGSARVLNGVNGALIFNFDGDNQNDHFGRAVTH